MTNFRVRVGSPDYDPKTGILTLAVGIRPQKPAEHINMSFNLGSTIEERYPVGSCWKWEREVVKLVDYMEDDEGERIIYAICENLHTGQTCYPEFNELVAVHPLELLAAEAEEEDCDD